MSNFKKHTIRLEGYAMEQGRIPFSLLQALIEQLTRLAASTLLAYVEGSSKVKRGKAPKWLLEAVAFDLTGIREGSTVLDIEAPVLSTHIQNKQLPLFQDFESDRLNHSTALDLSFFAYEQALNKKEASFLLDKNLLKEWSKFRKLLATEEAVLLFESDTKQLAITQAHLSEIKVLETKTAPSLKAKVTGQLDVLQHSTAQLELLVAGRKMRARLSDKLRFDDILELFGEEVAVSGIANFNPAGKITSFEIQAIQKATSGDAYFRTLPQPIFKAFDLQRIAEKQQYKGTALHKIIGKWPGEESTDELLEAV